jgi:uncharacterized protein YoxC
MNITQEQEGMTDPQIRNLEGNMRGMIKAKNDLMDRMNELIKQAQKMGYSINPKTGEVNKLP